MTLRERLYRQLDPMVWDKAGMSPLNQWVLVLVVLSILVVVVQSEPALRTQYAVLFAVLNWFFAVIFSIEYMVRLWVMGEASEHQHLFGRIRYALKPASILDLVATVSIWVDLLFGLTGIYGLICRLGRALRIITLSRYSRVGTALRLLSVAVRERATELLLSLALAFLVMLITATALFIIEGKAQPDAFGSIPRALWWAVATLTTVGYGDIYPITPGGKFFAAIATLTSIAIVAMPTGILAAAFSDAFQKLRKPNSNEE